MTKEMVKMAFKARYGLVLALALTGCAQGFTAKTGNKGVRLDDVENRLAPDYLAIGTR